MRNLLLSVIAIVFFTSCSPVIYQVSKVQSNNVKIIDSGFVYQDSLFEIDYYLWSKGGQMEFKIYNRAEVPIYIDWNKSNFILNGQSVDYWQDETTVKGVGIGGSYTVGRVSVGRSAYISDVKKEKPNSQLPPHSYIMVDRFAINAPFDTLGKYPKRGKSVTAQYSNSSSLLNFRNYIGYTKNQDLSNLKFISNDFWVSTVITINNDFSYPPAEEENFRIHYGSGNSFYVCSSVNQAELDKGNTPQLTAQQIKKQNHAGDIFGVIIVAVAAAFVIATLAH